MSFGTGLSLVAMSQFHAVVDTTTGTTHGSMSSTLNAVAPGTDVRSSSARPRPITQLPKTPTTVKINVKRVALQKPGSVKTWV